MKRQVFLNSLEVGDKFSFLGSSDVYVVTSFVIGSYGRVCVFSPYSHFNFSVNTKGVEVVKL